MRAAVTRVLGPTFLPALCLGQFISLLLVGTNVTSEYLARDNVHIPTTQSTLNYVLLSFLVIHRWISMGRIHLDVSWWVYALLAFADVEGNFLVVKSYQYTSITSVTLLDAFTIPCTMFLSKVAFKTRYKPVHVLAVVLCFVGLGLLVASDAVGGGRESIKGDLLCIAGATLYAISNVGQEAIVKSYDRHEFLGMIGLFGVPISVVQATILERDELRELDWSWAIVGWLLFYAACLFSMYMLVSVFLSKWDAALYNLSLLTSDIWAVIFGVFLFHTKLDWLYFVASPVIIVGLIVYHTSPVESPPAARGNTLIPSAGDRGKPAPGEGLAQAPRTGSDPLLPGRERDIDTADLGSGPEAATEPSRI